MALGGRSFWTTISRPAVAGALAVACILVGAVWQGRLPAAIYNAYPLHLKGSRPLLADVRLAALGRSAAACSASLTRDVAAASQIDDQAFEKGCGWRNAVGLSRIGNVAASVRPVTCEVAAATVLWVEHAVQAAAEKHVGARVTSVSIGGSYACRNIVGNPLWRGFRSQHATANAIDVFGFQFANGRSISVKGGWAGADRDAAFLREVRDGACPFFRAVLSPDYNEAHRDHFHFDRGYIKSCR